MRTLRLGILVLAVSGCGLSQKVQVGDPSGPGNKSVSGKEEPWTLVAVDGTLCKTTAAKFERVKIGDRVWCYWRERGETTVGVGGRVPVRR
jgi:hypothetical protein